MGFVKIALLGATLIATTMSFAEDVKPSAAEEQARIERIRGAKDMAEVFDNMTPGEIAEALGFIDEDTLILLQKVAVRTMPLVQIDVSISAQLLTLNKFNSVKQQYETILTARTSTGRRSDGYGTRRGDCWRPERIHKMWHSIKYDGSPMPWAVFYSGGFAIHGTGDLGNLGREASHGCVRLHPSHAKIVHDAVKEVGRENSLVCIPDEKWTPPKRASRRRR